MIITVSDAKGLTEKVESAVCDETDIKALYSKLFSNHITGITDGSIQWRIVKTTGDGLLIISQATVYEDKDFFQKWCSTMYKLFHDFTEPVPIRVVAHWCEDKNVFGDIELETGAIARAQNCILDLDSFRSHLGRDVFGPEVNLVFRILGLISGTVFIVTEALAKKLANIETGDIVRNEPLSIGEFMLGPPTPVTHLKGIDRFGFSSEEGNTPKAPLWLWEVSE